MELILATTNRGKFSEIAEALKSLPIDLLFLGDLPDRPTVIENAQSFEGNARKKAREISQWSRMPALADDSGLVVPRLGGRPGIFSARYALVSGGGSPSGTNGETPETRWGVRGGERDLPPPSMDAANRTKLLEEMTSLKGEERNAYFLCCLCVATPDGRELVMEGRCDGQIASEEKGAMGFGYDPLFFVPSLGKTMAELPLTEKNKLSHRGQALQKLHAVLLEFLKK